MAHILYLSTLLIMGLATFKGSLIMSITLLSTHYLFTQCLVMLCRLLYNFESKNFNPPYIMLHIICKMH